MSSINIKLYEALRRELNLDENKSKALAQAIEEAIQDDIKNAPNDYKSFWKEDFHTLDKRILESKNDTYKAIFITSLVQLIAILSGVLAIVKFVL